MVCFAFSASHFMLPHRFGHFRVGLGPPSILGETDETHRIVPSSRLQLPRCDPPSPRRSTILGHSVKPIVDGAILRSVTCWERADLLAVVGKYVLHAFSSEEAASLCRGSGTPSMIVSGFCHVVIDGWCKDSSPYAARGRAPDRSAFLQSRSPLEPRRCDIRFGFTVSPLQSGASHRSDRAGREPIDAVVVIKERRSDLPCGSRSCRDVPLPCGVASPICAAPASCLTQCIR